MTVTPDAGTHRFMSFISDPTLEPSPWSAKNFFSTFAISSAVCLASLSTVWGSQRPDLAGERYTPLPIFSTTRAREAIRTPGPSGCSATTAARWFGLDFEPFELHVEH